MASVTLSSSLKDYQDFVEQVYGSKNRREFSIDEMLTNVARFSMRGLKGIRKGDGEKIRLNMLISLSWFMSLMSQLEIPIEEYVWNRFPYLCSYCGECPCACKAKKIQKRIQPHIDQSVRPKTIRGLQEMFGAIYPASARTLEHAGIHLAEEVGELSEAVLRFRGMHGKKDFDKVSLEAADLFSCFMGVLNSAGIDYAAALAEDFSDGCHVCKHAPCTCEYGFVIDFKS